MRQNAYKVLVVEDEQTALQHVCRIIENRIPGFSIAATAENGAAGLEAIRRHQPDLVITDVHMPVMDGIDLIARAMAEFPWLTIIVISGYQDFDYVKGALTEGASDYVLKPLSPMKMTRALSKIRPKLADLRTRRQIDLLEHIAYRKDVSTKEINDFFLDASFYIGVYRQHGLPSRYGNSFGSGKPLRKQGLLAFSGRDSHEMVFLAAEDEIPTFVEFRHKAKNIAFADEEKTRTHILAVRRTPVRVKDFGTALWELLSFIDGRLVMGIRQTVDFPPEQRHAVPSFDSGILPRLGVLLRENKFDAFRSELLMLQHQWFAAGLPLKWIEDALDRILRFTLESAMTPEGPEVPEDYDTRLDEVFSHASSLDEMTRKVMDIFQDIIIRKFGTFCIFNSPEFFAKVTGYIENHCAEQINLSLLCAVFGISQAYMSKLFRTHADTSCNAHIKQVRMEKAKKIMSESKHLQIKDIALMVGFKDQFYFSKLFHRTVGMTPSEYMTGIHAPDAFADSGS